MVNLPPVTAVSVLVIPVQHKSPFRVLGALEFAFRAARLTLWWCLGFLRAGMGRSEDSEPWTAGGTLSELDDDISGSAWEV